MTVWCVLNGSKYANADAHILKDMVARNLSIPHRFRCLSDRPVAGIDCLTPEENWPGWWAKLLLFKYGEGQCLYFDLDVVIVGDVAPLLSDRLSMPANWAQSGHGGCQSSVMAWRDPIPRLHGDFDPALLDPPTEGNCGLYRGLWGDQEYITEKLGDPGEYVVPMKGVYSYKYHCRGGLPNGARVVCFHGRPKPSEVSDSWVRASRSM